MKKLICSLVITLIMGLSVNAFAQKAGIATMAYLNVKTSKKVVDEKTAVITFQLNNITDASIMEKYRKSFTKFQRVQQVTATKQAGNMASYSVKMDKEGTLKSLQTMFATARIPSVNVDGKVVATKDLDKLKKPVAAPSKK